jgi:hypothetical protein
MYKLFFTIFMAGMLLVNGCTTAPSGGTEVENERFIAHIVDSDGKPVSGATVTILPVDYIPNATALAKTTLTTLRQTTGSDGSFSTADLDEGCYTIYAEKGAQASYNDSIYITVSGIEVDEFVLDEKGEIVGYVQVQPNHDPRIVEVQILGTHLYTNVDSDGKYTFPDIALGTYLLRGFANQDGYIPTYLEVNTDPPSASEEYPNLIRMLYTGIPIVEDISAVFDPETRLVTLSWSESSYRDLYEYVIFRDREGATQPTTEPLAVTTDTEFIDSTADDVNNGSTAPFRYRIAIRDNSMILGPTYGYSSVEVPYYSLTLYSYTSVDSVMPFEEIEVSLQATSSPSAIKQVRLISNDVSLHEKTYTTEDDVYELKNAQIDITVPDTTGSSWCIIECIIENFDGYTAIDTITLNYTGASLGETDPYGFNIEIPINDIDEKNQGLTDPEKTRMRIVPVTVYELSSHRHETVQLHIASSGIIYIPIFQRTETLEIHHHKVNCWYNDGTTENI